MHVTPLDAHVLAPAFGSCSAPSRLRMNVPPKRRRYVSHHHSLCPRLRHATNGVTKPRSLRLARLSADMSNGSIQQTPGGPLVVLLAGACGRWLGPLLPSYTSRRSSVNLR